MIRAQTQLDSDIEMSRAFVRAGAKNLDPVDIVWEGVTLQCHSQYELLGLVLSILGRAPPGATRRNHHLPLLILCVNFVILAAGKQAKKSAPSLVSIMFTDDDGDFKVQMTCNSPELTPNGPDLNVVMGSIILQGKPDLPKESIEETRTAIGDVRYDFLENKGGYKLPGRYSSRKGVCYCGACGETFSLVLLRQ